MKRHKRKPGRWDRFNTREALARRAAKADARRERMALELPPVDRGPAPGDPWLVLRVESPSGVALHTLRLYVPTHGRCDQHASEVDGVRADRMLTATAIGTMVAGWVPKRPSVEMLSEVQT